MCIHIYIYSTTLQLVRVSVLGFEVPKISSFLNPVKSFGHVLGYHASWKHHTNSLHLQIWTMATLEDSLLGMLTESILISQGKRLCQPRWRWHTSPGMRQIKPKLCLSSAVVRYYFTPFETSAWPVCKFAVKLNANKECTGMIGNTQDFSRVLAPEQETETVFVVWKHSLVNWPLFCWSPAVGSPFFQSGISQL